MRTFRLALAQMNATVGDFDGNAERIIEGIHEARELGADLVAFPELALPGYPPEDLLLKPQFIRENHDRIAAIAAECRGIAAIVGYVDSDSDIYNAAAFIHDGRIVGTYRKMYPAELRRVRRRPLLRRGQRMLRLYAQRHARRRQHLRRHLVRYRTRRWFNAQPARK